MTDIDAWVLLGFDPETDELVESFALTAVTTEDARAILGLPIDEAMYDSYPVRSPSARAWVEARAETKLSPGLEYFIEQQELGER